MSVYLRAWVTPRHADDVLHLPIWALDGAGCHYTPLCRVVRDGQEWRVVGPDWDSWGVCAHLPICKDCADTLQVLDDAMADQWGHPTHRRRTDGAA